MGIEWNFMSEKSTFIKSFLIEPVKTHSVFGAAEITENG